jgi:hypothetical protein
MIHFRPLVFGLLLVPFLLLVQGMLGPEASAAPRRPPTLEIVTVPPLPAARFTLDGQPLVTDERGVARIAVAPTPAGHEIALTNPLMQGSDTTTEFMRWYGHRDEDQGFTPTLHQLHIDKRTKLVATFQVSRTVKLSFVDQAHRPVDPGRISAVTLRSDTNHMSTTSGGEPLRLVAVRPAPGDRSAVAKEASYSVQNVTMDGANVVNVGEQRFRPSQGPPVLEVVVLLRSMHVQVTDLLLGSPAPSSVLVTSPDGRRQDLSTDAQGVVTLQNLARGTYTLLPGGHPYSVPQEVSLSRSQFVNLKVVTYADAAILAVIGVVLVVGLVTIGRRRARRHRMQTQEAADRTDDTVIVDDEEDKAAADELGDVASTTSARSG